MKRLIYGLGAVIAVIVLGLLLAPAFLEPDQYRDLIEDQVEDALGRPVTIEGELSLSLLPSPSLSAEGVRIANVPGASTVDFVKIGALEIDVATGPLLRGVVQVERTVLVEPVVNLEVLQSGGNNWTITGKTAPASVPEDPGGFDVSLDDLLIENGTINYVDGSTGTTHQFSQVNAQLAAETMAGPFRVDGELQWNDLIASINASLGDTSRSRFPMEAKLHLSDYGLEITLNGVGFADDAHHIFDGKVRAQAEDLRHLLAELMGVEDTPAGDPVLLAVDGRASLTQEALTLEDVDIALGQVSGRAELGMNYGGMSDIRAIVSLPVLDTEALALRDWLDSVEPRDDDTPFAIPSDMAASLDLTIEGIRLEEQTIRQIRLAARMENEQVEVTNFRALLPGSSDISLGGVVQAQSGTPAFEGQFRIGSSNFHALLTSMGVPVEGIPKNRLTQLIGSGTLSAIGSIMRLADLALKVDSTNLTGGLAYGLGRERPSIGFSIKADRLNADAYIPAPAPDEAAETDWNAFVKSLSGYDLNGTLGFDQLTYQRETIRQLAVDMRVTADGLTINSLNSPDLAGARVEAKNLTVRHGDVLSVSGDIGVASSDLNRLVRLAGYSELTQSLRLTSGQADLGINMQGDQLDVRGKGTLGITQANMRIQSSNWGAPAATMIVQLDMQNDSWRSLSQIAGLDVVSPAQDADVPVSAKATLEATGQVYQMNIGLSLGQAQLGVTGEANLNGDSGAYDLMAQLDASDALGALSSIGVAFDAPSLKGQPLNLSAMIKGPESELQLQALEGRIGKTVFNGTAILDAASDVTAVKATLDFGTFDLGSFLGPQETGAKAAKRNSRLRWSDDPIDLGWLDSIKADVTLSANELLFHQYTFTKPRITLAAGAQGITVSDMQAGLFGGALSLKGSLLRGGEKLELTTDFEMQRTSVAQLLAAAADLTVATGNLTIGGTISGQGNSQKEIISSLDGTVNMQAVNGVVQGVDMVRMSETMLTLVEYDDFISLVRTAMNGGETRYERIEAPFTIKNGVAKTGPVAAVLEASEATVNATIDLPRWTLDTDVDFRLTDPGHEQTPSVGLRLTGAIDAPRRQTRAKEMTAFIGRRLANRLLEDFGGERSSGLRQLLGGSSAPQTPDQPSGQPGSTIGAPPPGQADGQTTQGEAPKGQPPEQQQEQPTQDPLGLLLRGILNEVTKDKETQN